MSTEETNNKQENINESTEDDRPSYMKKRVIVPTITAVLLLIMGLILTVHSIFYQSTDDAFVEGHIVTIAPRVYGPVEQMLITDNQQVKKGDLLIVIDPTDYEVKLAQAKAKLAQAKAALKISEKEIAKSNAVVKESSHEVVSSKSKLDFASKDYTRYSSMYKEGITSKQDYDSSKTGLTVAKSNHKSALEKQQAAQASLGKAQAQKDSAKADIEMLEAEVKECELNLSYTKIYAPQDGLITNRTVEQGNFVQVAQPMFAIVPEKVWVVANFKETQLANMKPGQDVKIKIDTYPGKKFKGKVDSIQRATGAKASLFPPENAVGSYVKIVQRVPVKIVFTEDISKYNIVPGMSVVPEVKVK